MPERKFNPMTRRILATGILFLAVMIVFSIAYQWLNAKPIIIDDQIGDTVVHIQVERSQVFSPRRCVPIHWSIDNAVSVTLDGIPQPDSDALICYQSHHVSNQLRTSSLESLVRVDFADGQFREYPIKIRVTVLHITTWLRLFLATLLVVLSGYVIPIPFVSPLSHYMAQGLAIPTEVDRRQRRLAAWAGHLWSGLNLVFLVAILTTIGNEASFSGMVFACLATFFALCGFVPAVQVKTARIMQSRFMILAPLFWFFLSVVVIDYGMGAAGASTSIINNGVTINMRLLEQDMTQVAQPQLWSSVQSWSATIFLWLCVYWLASYCLRQFEFDAARRFAWLTVFSLTILICVLGFFVPYVMKPYQAYLDIFPTDNDPPLLYHAAMQNGDSWQYVSYTIDFPYIFRTFKAGDIVIHRPTFYLMTSQVCQVLDIFRVGYTSGDRHCGSLTIGLFAHWLINAAIHTVSMIIIYELIRAYLGSARIAWMGAVLASIAALNVWFISVPSTDYSEMIIATASLWIIHTLFKEKPAPIGRIILAGILLGLLLLLKLNGTYLIFGVLLCVSLGRWRILPAFTVLPGIVWYLYPQLLDWFGAIYSVVELGPQWRAGTWLLTEFPHLSLYQQVRTMTVWFGNTSDKVALMYGGLLILGVLGMMLNERYPRKYMAIAWGLFISIAAFAWIFQYSYINHVLGLMPFIYGAIALNIDTLQTAIQTRYANYPRLTQYLALGLWGLAVFHNLLQWIAWDTFARITYGP